jgi:DNA-directed RNA polymerase subunit RPC12/RpoP
MIIQVSPTFRCAECGARLLEVRGKPDQIWHDLRCPRCDKDLLKGS